MPDGNDTMVVHSGRLGRELNDSVKVSFSSKTSMSQEFEIESTHHLAPTKSKSTNIQWNANGAPRAKFSLQTIGAHVASPLYHNKAVNCACSAIEKALKLQARLKALPHSHVSSEWPMPSGLPLGAAGKFHPSNVVRIWDKGATQGMTDAASACRDKIFKGAETSIQTGQGVARSNHWILEQLSPEVSMKHIILSDAANTIAVGELNEVHSLRFLWPEKLSTQSSAASPCAFKSLDACIKYCGTCEIWPMRVTSNTPKGAIGMQ